LLPQGGIDQINHAITLQLIQRFKHKVRLFQQPDGLAPTELSFTHAFLNDLNKQKILKHLEDFQFGLLSELLLEGFSEKDKIYNLAKYAYQKLNLNYTAFPQGIEKKYKESISVWVRCKDLYISAKINFKVGDYGNYLWKLYTLYENLYRAKCEEYIGETQNFYHQKYDYDRTLTNNEWIDFLKNCISQEVRHEA
jgi:hypothetical protein